MKLWVRITLSFAIMLVLISVAVSVVVNNQVSNDMQVDQERWSELLTRAIAKSILNDTIEKNRRAVKETLSRISKHAQDLDYILIVDFEGAPFASTFDGDLIVSLEEMDHSLCAKSSNNITGSHKHITTSVTGAGKNNVEHEHNITDYVYPLIPNLDAHIHLGIKQDAVQEAINNTQNRVLMIISLVSVLGIFIAAYIGRQISHPIEQLTLSVRQFRKDGTMMPVDNKVVDEEVKELIDNFEELIVERQKYEQEIIEYRDELENRVKERTANLADEITKHKETAEQLLLSRDEAEKANKAKSQFLSSMSHELRTPLNAIMGFSQLLEMTLPEDDEENKDNVKEVINAGTHLLSLINEVLDLAKIESGKLEISLEPVFWKNVLSESINLVRKSAEQRNITILYDNKQCLSGQVLADALKLKQVVINLLSNAVKYNRDNGQIFVSLNTVDDKTCRLTVRDTGNGIPENLQKRVFTAFERLGAQNSSIEGTGIGLVIVKALVEKMNGKIDFESKLGEGTSFWIDMPLINSDNTQSFDTEQLNNLRADNKKTIVYIEDNESNINMVKKLFRDNKNIELLVAETPSAGFKLLESVKPDLILLDINLPEMSGFEVMRILSSDLNTRDIKVLAVSANAMQHDIEEAMEYGFVDYLTKPFNLKQFLDIINTHLA